MAYSPAVNPMQLLYAMYSNFGTLYSVEQSWFLYGRSEFQTTSRLSSKPSRFLFIFLNTLRQILLMTFDIYGSVHRKRIFKYNQRDVTLHNLFISV